MAAGDRSTCHRTGKAITTVIVWLLLGAIVNVAVAWGLTPFVLHVKENKETRSRLPTRFAENGNVIEWWWAEEYLAVGTTALGVRWRRNEMPASYFDGTPSPATIVPKWLGFHRPSEAFANGTIEKDEFAAILWGLPCRSLAALARSEGEWQRCVLIGQTPEPTLPRMLPVLPIWPGFAINTVFYAMILWGLFATPFALRRWRRLKRGLCVKCGYDLRGRPQGSTCPECGSIVAS